MKEITRSRRLSDVLLPSTLELQGEALGLVLGTNVPDHEKGVHRISKLQTAVLGVSTAVGAVVGGPAGAGAGYLSGRGLMLISQLIGRGD